MKQTPEEAAKQAIPDIKDYQNFVEHDRKIWIQGAEWALSQQSPLIGIEELISDDAISNEAEKRFDLIAAGWHTRKKHYFKEGAFYLRDLILPHLRTSNTQSEAVEFANWIVKNEYSKQHHSTTYWSSDIVFGEPKTTTELFTEFQNSKGIKQD